MRTLILSTVIITFILAAGCKNSPSIVGKWQSAANPSVIIEFLSDGTFNLEPTGMARNVKLIGNYTVNENKVKLSEITVDLPDNNPLKGPAASFLGAMTGENLLTLSWKTDNEIVLDGQGMIKGGFKRVTQ